MKTIAHYLVILMLLCTCIASGKNPKAILSYKTFYAADTGPYIETYLSVSGQSVNYSKLDNGKFQGKIEIALTFKQNNEIKHFDKYNLLSPEVSDTNQTAFNFIDQQRIQLNNGKYLFEIAIADKNSTVKPFTSSQEINMEYYPNLVSLSDIELVDSYKKSEIKSMLTKNGFEVVPYVNNYYPAENNSLKFYGEVYNAQKVLGDEPFLVSYFIETFENKRIIEKFRGFKKQEPNNINVILSEFPINELPSGNYNLVVEIRNKKNDILAFKETFFQRNNNLVQNMAADSQDFTQIDIANTFTAQLTDKDNLKESIRSLRPISNNNEVTFEDNQVKIADVKTMQQFLYDFWVKREPRNPEKAWMEYEAQVNIANEKFKALHRKGYETDRGRVFLQYGPPNAVQEAYHEPSTYPYEIWQYYKIKTQSNRRFVFYDSDLVSNNFILLHSDAQGEPYEEQWQLKLQSRNNQSRDMDHPIKNEGYGNNANQNYINPR